MHVQSQEPKDARQISLASVVLDMVVCHQNLESFYRSKAEHVTIEEPRMLLNLLANQEKARSIELRDYIRNPAPSVSNAWLKVAPKFRTDEWIQKYADQQLTGLHDVLNAAIEVNQIMIKLLHSLEEQVQADEVKDFLLDMQKRIERDHVFALKSAELQ